MIIRHSTLSFLALAIPLFVGLFTVPSIINGLGVERFGVLTLIWALVGYASIFDFGIARALTKRVAELKGNVEQIQSVAWTGLAILVALGITVGAVILIYGRLFTFSKSALIGSELTYSIQLLVASVPFVMLSGGLRGVLEGVHRFGSVAVVRLCFGLITFGAPVLVVSIAPRLDAIVGMMLIGRVVSCLGLAYACREYLPRNKPSVNQQLIEAKLMFQFGRWITLSNLVSPIMVYMDRFFLASSLYANDLAFYTTPYEFVTKLFIVPSALTGVLFPRMARDAQLKKNGGRLLVAGCSATLFLLAPITAGLSLFAKEIIGWWISPDFAVNASAPLQILAAGVLINSLAQIFQTHLFGYGYASWMARLHMVELFIYLPVLYFFLNQFGIEGVAFAWTLRVSADAILLACKTGRSSRSSGRDSWLIIFIGHFAGIVMLVGIQFNFLTKLIIWFGICLVTAGFSFWVFRKTVMWAEK